MPEHYTLPTKRKWLRVNECVANYKVAVSTLTQALQKRVIKGRKQRIKKSEDFVWQIDPVSFHEWLKKHEKRKRPRPKRNTS